jgi:hypothetical protein
MLATDNSAGLGIKSLCFSFCAQHKEQLALDSIRRVNSEPAGQGKIRGANALRKGRCAAPAEYHGANGHPDFVNQAFAKERVVQFRPAFANKAADVPIAAQSLEGGMKIDFVPPTNPDVVGEFFKEA